MFPFRVLSRRWRRISAVILGKVISVKFLPFSRGVWRSYMEHRILQRMWQNPKKGCRSSPFHREEGPGGLHLGAVGPVGLPWSSADAAVSRGQCSLAAAAFHLHLCRHFFWSWCLESINHIWIICCLRGFIVQHLFLSKTGHCVIWPKPGGKHILPCHFMCCQTPSSEVPLKQGCQ